MSSLEVSAGFFAAHAVWSVYDGETLCPFVGTVDSNGKRHIERFEDDEYSEAVASAQRFVNDCAKTCAHVVLAYDGYITFAGVRSDALIIEATSFANSGTTLLRVSLPYRPANSAEGFALFRPKFHIKPEQEATLPAIAEAFFTGVDSHEKAAKVWKEFLVESP